MTSLLIICKLQISQNIAMSWTSHVSLHTEAALNDYNDYCFLTIYLFVLRRAMTVPVLVCTNFFEHTTLGPFICVNLLLPIRSDYIISLISLSINLGVQRVVSEDSSEVTTSCNVYFRFLPIPGLRFSLNSKTF